MASSVSTVIAPPAPTGSSDPTAAGTRPDDLFRDFAAFIQSMSPDTASKLFTQQNITISDTTNFELYSGGSFIVVRFAKICWLVGTLSCKTANYLNTNLDRLLGTLPTEFRPIADVRGRQQSSGSDTWLLAVLTSGQITASRHSGTTHIAGLWMPFSLMWMTA